MSRFIKQAANTEQLKRELIQKFISWYLDIHKHNYGHDYIIQAMTPTSSPNTICGVYSTMSNTICGRKTTTLNQYCWQHKNQLLNVQENAIELT
jgi:hypothetical protein